MESVDSKNHKGVFPFFYVSCVGFIRPTHDPWIMGLYEKESLRESKAVQIVDVDGCNGSLRRKE